MEKLFKKYNLNEINKEKINKFNIYFKNLIEWNNQFNLTAITDEREVQIKHFLDSVFPEFLIEKNAKILDIGAGAGFPSLPLKIYRDDLDVTMLDSLNKRVNFLNHIITILNLKNTRAEHSRAEDFAKNHRDEFDYVVVRAVAKLSTLLEYALPLLKIGGKLIAYKSFETDDEIENSKNALNILGGKVVNIKKYVLEENQRSVIVIEKIKTTPHKYPRDKNLPKVKPL